MDTYEETLDFTTTIEIEPVLFILNRLLLFLIYNNH